MTPTMTGSTTVHQPSITTMHQEEPSPDQPTDLAARVGAFSKASPLP